MTPLLWLAAIVAFIAVFSYFVIGLIYAKPAEPLRSFADAFRIRKDDT